ncbi:MAG: hypothetical protein KGH60_00485 [Candidatus Micrarchaeota archaeon]|nr:hypothetical protein [Candidatus Micrarchaeota archaeon]
MHDRVRLWPILEAAIFRRTNLIERIGTYELSGDRQSAIRRHKGKIISTAMASIEGSTESGIDRKAVESVISRLNFPFKFTVQVSALNAARILDRLETRRAMLEIELSKISGSKSGKGMVRANAARRELELIEHDIKGMTTGSTPLKMALLISTSSVSESRFYAEERAKTQIRELAGEFGAITNSQVRVLSGTELAEAMMLDNTMML